MKITNTAMMPGRLSRAEIQFHQKPEKLNHMADMLKQLNAF